MVLAEPWTFLRLCHPQSGPFFLPWDFSSPLPVRLDPLERCAWSHALMPLSACANQLRVKFPSELWRKQVSGDPLVCDLKTVHS